MVPSQTILVSPLEWGLGHTVRVVPFIRKALREGHQVILASDGASLDFLRYCFPGLPYIRLPFYPIRYPDDARFFRKLIPQTVGILRAIKQNHKQLKAIVKQYQITDVISDHRYGLWNKNVHSVFITNQLWLKAPTGWTFGEPVVYAIHRWVLRKFSEVWVADFEGEPNLSGQLTHPSRLPRQARYIGPVSRFQDILPRQPEYAGPFEVLALVSGPEPQRSIFENRIKERLFRSRKSAVIFRGIPPASPLSEPEIVHEKSVTMIDHACDEHLLWYILMAREIICRPGNSTLSDLTYLGKSALLVPTPGQTEQEYVAGHLADQGTFQVLRQEEL